MISQKNLSWIENLDKTYSDEAKKNITRSLKKPTIFEVDETNPLVAKVKCWNCGFENEIDLRKHTSCPHCKEELSQGKVQSYYYFHFIEEENGFTILQYDAQVDADMKTYNVNVSLEGICSFEGNKISFFENTADVGIWARRAPKDRYYYGYGRSSDVFCNLTSEEQEDFKKKFKPIFGKISNMYRYENKGLARLDLFFRINRAYKEAVDAKEIIKTTRKKEDKTPNIEIPSISKKDIKLEFPAITKITVEKEGMVYMGHCHTCGHKFPTEKYRYSSEDKCPNCKRENLQENKDGMAIAALEQEDGGLIIAVYRYEVAPINDGNNYHYEIKSIKKNAAILISEQGICFYKNENENTKKANCSEVNHLFQRFSLRFSYTTVTFVGGAKSFVKKLENSVLKKTGYIEFCKYHVTSNNLVDLGEDSLELLARELTVNINYLNIYNNCPAIEQLAKSKMTNFIKDMITKVSCPKYINKKETTPNKILGISKAQFKEIRDADISQQNFETYKEIIKLDPNAAYSDCVRFMNRFNMPQNLFEILSLNIPKINMKEIEKYAQSLDDYQCIDWVEGIRLWKDYLRMCIELKCDMNDRTVIFTNSLKLEHDRTVRKYNNLKNQTAIKNFEEAVKQYQYLEYEDEEHDFKIIVPHSQEELYEEGRVLHHCVGSYARSVAEGRSTILFIRSKEKPDVPLCTVEVSNGKLVQARTKYNNMAYTVPGVKKFMQAWAKEKKIVLNPR